MMICIEHLAAGRQDRAVIYEWRNIYSTYREQDSAPGMKNTKGPRSLWSLTSTGNQSGKSQQIETRWDVSTSLKSTPKKQSRTVLKKDTQACCLLCWQVSCRNSQNFQNSDKCNLSPRVHLANSAKSSPNPRRSLVNAGWTHQGRSRVLSSSLPFCKTTRGKKVTTPVQNALLRHWARGLNCLKLFVTTHMRHRAASPGPMENWNCLQSFKFDFRHMWAV